MMSKPGSTKFMIGAALSLCLSACNPTGAASDEATENGASTAATIFPTPGSGEAQGSSGSNGDIPNLAQGPDVCFRAVAKHLGADAKVSEITSFFSAGNEIDSSATQPQGEMVICTVQYQNPDDPRKLLSARLDVKSGTFGAPSPVEITVAGGNAAQFNIEDYLIPLSKVDAAALVSVMNAQKAKLGSVYGRYAWTGVRLTAPGAFSNTHNLRLDLTGRLASNDIKEDGYASVTIDGKTIKMNYLLP